MKKKTKRMAEGGMATTTSTPTRNPRQFGAEMLERLNQLRAQIPNFNWRDTMPGGRRGERDEDDDRPRRRRDGRGGERRERGDQTPRPPRTPPARPNIPRPATRPIGGGMTRPSTPGKTATASNTAPTTTTTTPAAPKKSNGISKLFYSTGPAWSQDYKAGGLVKANGCASRGKTKGKIV